MKIFILIGLLAAAAAVSYEDVFFEEWNLYKAEFKKSYESPIENFQRMEAFLKKKYEVAQHNLRYKNGEESYDMEINEFSDWLPEEFDAMNGFNKEIRDLLAAGEAVAFPEFEGEIFEVGPNTTAPASMDWVAKGAVSPVKNQGACGSCYAFSANGALESQKYIKTKKMVRLSEQNIVDCSGKYGNKGCNGGSVGASYNYIKDAGGVNTESSYPYQGKQGTCRFNKNNIGASVSGYVKVGASEASLKEAVGNIGPVAVAIHSMNSLSSYRSGVYYDANCKNSISSLNHAVLVVGYGTDAASKKDYWIVKNSWGTGWGEKGYVRMARNKNNMCGIATYAIYPNFK